MLPKMRNSLYLYISSHNCTVIFTDCCNFKKHGGVSKLLAEITHQFFIFALSIKVCRMLLKFDIAHFVALGSTGRFTVVYELSNKSFKISKNWAVCYVLFVFILPVNESGKESNSFIKKLKHELAFHFLKIIKVDTLFWLMNL